MNQPLAPSDTVVKFVSFLDHCRKECGFAKDTYIDNADQGTITELRKYKRLHGCVYNFWDAYKQLEVIDRINLQLGWIQQGCYLVVDTCTEYLSELERYSWDDEKDKPEETNAIRNRIWYRGDSNELEQLYLQTSEYADKYKFWTSRCSPGMEMRKIHTGLSGLIVRILASITLADMNEFKFSDKSQEELWKQIETVHQKCTIISAVSIGPNALGLQRTFEDR